MQRQMAKNMLNSLKDPDYDKKGGMGGAMMPPPGAAGGGQGMNQDAGGDSGGDGDSKMPFNMDSLKKKLGF